MSLKQRAVRGVAWSAVQKWGVRIITFLVTLILYRLISPEAFGLVAYAVVFFDFAGIFVDQGFSDAIVQFPNLEKEHLDTAFWVNVLAGTLLAIVTFAASGVIANLFHEPRLIPIFKWGSLVFILGALNSVQASLLRRNLAFRALTLRSLLSIIISGIVAVIMAFLGFGVWSLVAETIVLRIVSVITLWQVSDWRPRFRLSRKHFKDLFSYGIHIAGGNLVEFFSVHSDDFLIGYFLGSTALGYYSLGYNMLLMLTDLLVTVPNMVAFPIFSKLQQESSRLKSAFYEVTQLQSLIAFPIFLGICSVAPEAIRVLYTDKWASSIPVVQILMLIGVVRSAIYFYSSIFRAAGKPSWRFGVYALTAVLNVTGFLIVVRMGIVAVAASYVVVSYLMMPLYFFLIRKIVDVPIRSHLKQYIPAFVSSLIMVFAVFAFRYFIGQNFSITVRLVILVLAGAVTYLLAIRIIRPALYTKMLELAKMVLPGFLVRKIKPKIN